MTEPVYDHGHTLRISTASWEKLASHSFTTFPQLEGVKFTYRVNLPLWSMDCDDHNRGRRNLAPKAHDAVGLGFDS